MRPLTDPKTSNIVDYTISEGRSYTVCTEYTYKRDDRIMTQICSCLSKVGQRIFFSLLRLEKSLIKNS
jgi:hypothetical protein